MTADQRIEKLLNRAGQTISDLPLAYNLDKDSLKEILDVATQWFVGEDFPHQARVDITTIPLAQYILHLTDIIDRMETALENVCGERDYLAYRLRRYRDCQSCERVNKCDRTPDHCLGWAFGGVPDGSADDD